MSLPLEASWALPPGFLSIRMAHGMTCLSVRATQCLPRIENALIRFDCRYLAGIALRTGRPWILFFPAAGTGNHPASNEWAVPLQSECKVAKITFL